MNTKLTAFHEITTLLYLHLLCCIQCIFCFQQIFFFNRLLHGLQLFESHSPLKVLTSIKFCHMAAELWYLTDNLFSLWFMRLLIKAFPMRESTNPPLRHSNTQFQAVLYFSGTTRMLKRENIIWEYLLTGQPLASINGSYLNPWYRDLGHNYFVLFEKSAVQGRSPPTCFAYPDYAHLF